MTIERGADWGRVTERPPELVPAGSDARLAELLRADRSSRVLVVDGDLARTLGTAVAGERTTVLELPIDLVSVTTDTGTYLAVAHVTARRRASRGGWWRGPVLAVMNAQFLGAWNVAPRGHPNDGRVEVQECSASMSLRERLAVRRRLPAGAHLPHPRISTRSVRTASWTFEHPMEVFVDGRTVGTTRSLRIGVEPDAAVVYR